MKKLTIVSALAISLHLSACTLTSAGVKPGDERNFSRSFNDISVERVIEARLKRAEDFDLTKVNVEVTEGIVVLAGRALSEDARIEAERIAWSAPHVDQVGNEIMIGDEGVGFIRGTKDSVLASSIRTRLIADRSVKSRNVNIETENGIVYLLGVARNPEELERIAYIASTTKGAREVVSYVKLHEGNIPAQTQTYAGAGAVPQNAIPYTGPTTGSFPQIQPPPQPLNQPLTQQRALPEFLTEAPQGPSISAPTVSAPSQQAIDPLAPYYRDPLTGERIELDPRTGTIPFQPSAQSVLPNNPLSNPLNNPVAKVTPLLEAPTEFPSDEALGRFRTGSPGDAVSIIESAPYYIDPDTGAEIPVSFIR